MAGNFTHAQDTDKIREIAGQLNTQAGKVGELVSNGTSQAGMLAQNWLGNDSDQFASEWQQAAKSLQQAQDSLGAYSKAAMSQAEQQEKGSGGSGA